MDKKYEFLKKRFKQSYYIKLDNPISANKVLRELLKIPNYTANHTINLSSIENYFNIRVNEKSGLCLHVFNSGNMMNITINIHTYNEMKKYDNYFINYPKEIDLYYQLHNLIPSYKPKKIERII